jgi:hypothetical protein
VEGNEVTSCRFALLKRKLKAVEKVPSKALQERGIGSALENHAVDAHITQSLGRQEPVVAVDDAVIFAPHNDRRPIACCPYERFQVVEVDRAEA